MSECLAMDEYQGRKRSMWSNTRDLFEDAARRWSGSLVEAVRLGGRYGRRPDLVTEGGIELWDFSSPDWRKQPEQRSHYVAGTDRGLYVIYQADEDGALGLTSEAGFVPADASGPEAVELLYAFDLGGSEVGADLLRACYQRDEAEPYIELARRVRDDVTRSTLDAVDAHRFDRFQSAPDPFDRVSPETRADIAVRQYPWRQALGKDWELVHSGTWVCFLPDDRVIRYENAGQLFIDHLDGTHLHWGEPLDIGERERQQLLFRPTDEHVDPGLAERFRAAIRVPASEEVVTSAHEDDLTPF